MISFPIVLPAAPTTSDIKLTASDVVGESVSPFTHSQQEFEYFGEWWEAQCSLPPMVVADADPWVAALLATRGKSGVFLLGDPAKATPRGSAGRSNVNLLAWSESIDNNSFWSRGAIASLTADAIVDPNGFTTAESATANSGASDANTSQQIPVSAIAGQTVTASIWLKVPSGTANINIFLTDNTGNSPRTCPLTTVWQRFSVTRSFGGGITSASLQVGGGGSWTNSQVMHIWGAQVEVASSASAYIGTSYAQILAQGFAPQIAMNGTTQGPKIALLKGLAPNSVAFKVGDYIECGYGLNATRIQLTSGSSADGTYYSGAVSASGQVYTDSVRVRNLGAKTLRIYDNFGHNSQLAPSSAEATIALNGTGDGVGVTQLIFGALLAGDAIDLVAWSPRMQRQGIDENLIPVANQNFTSWTVGAGRSVTLIQGYNRRLYKVLSDATSDAKGNCGVDIFPRWRNGDAIADGDPVNVFSPKGLFRLTDNARQWSIDNAMLHGISFNAKEAF